MKSKPNIFPIISIAVLLALAGCEKETGAYVYIKKGYECFDQEKYAQGLKYLKKAYRKVPQSPEVRKYVMNGYIIYGRFCDSQGDFDRAVSLLEEAYAIDQDDENVIHNLGCFYAEKAYLLAEAGDTDGARDLLRKIVASAERTRVTRKSVSNYLNHMAVRAYSKNEYVTALWYLEASFTLWKRQETADFLGEIYYRNGDFDKAREYWQMVKANDPSNQLIDKKLRVLDQEAAHEQEMNHYDIGHFDIQFHKDDDIDILMLEGILKKVYQDVGQDLEYYPEQGTRIVFYNQDDFKRIFQKPAMVRAFYDGKMRIPLYFALEDQEFLASLAHEYTHAVIALQTHMMCPVWLNEGVAVYEQSRYSSISFRFLPKAVREGQYLTLGMIDKGFAGWHNPANVVLSYEAAYSVVLFIKDKWGWDRLRSLLDRFKTGQHYANALDDEFLMSFEQFEAQWNAYLREKFQ